MCRLRPNRARARPRAHPPLPPPPPNASPAVAWCSSACACGRAGNGNEPPIQNATPGGASQVTARLVWRMYSLPLGQQKCVAHLAYQAHFRCFHLVDAPPGTPKSTESCLSIRTRLPWRMGFDTPLAFCAETALTSPPYPSLLFPTRPPLFPETLDLDTPPEQTHGLSRSTLAPISTPLACAKTPRPNPCFPPCARPQHTQASPQRRTMGLT